MKNESPPMISIITICWNCVNEIEETIQSVINQTYPFIEYIVVDGASNDGTLDVINKYRKKIDILISEKDNGIYNAMNKGVRLAHGLWCIFMNAGDSFASNTVLEDMFIKHIPHERTKVYYGNTWMLKKSGCLLMKASSVYPTIKRCQPYIHQSAFFNIETKKRPFYDEKYKIASDYNTSLWFYNTYGKHAFEYVNVAVSKFKNYGGISTSETNKRKKEEEFLSIYKNNSICKTRFIREYIKYLIRYNLKIRFLERALNIYVEKKNKQAEFRNTIN